MGFARLAEDGIRKVKGKADGEALGALDKIMASTVGGALATWNQPIEVIRVEVCDRRPLSPDAVLTRYP
jgi:Mitochondrial carrier protein